MRNKLTKLAAIAIIGLVFSLIGEAQAQFSKTVIMLKGVVRSEQSGKAHSVKVSVRAAGDKALEITASTSNSESGSYLVILQANKKYWVHLEGEDIITKDVLIETPIASKTVQVNKDFAVTTITVAHNTSDKASMQ